MTFVGRSLLQGALRMRVSGHGAAAGIQRSFVSSVRLGREAKDLDLHNREVLTIEEARAELKKMAETDDSIAPGAPAGTVPTDLEHATGLERLELLGKLAGEDFFDFSTLPADRLGTMKDPIMVTSFHHTRHIGCTGCPADSHQTLWLTLFRNEPARCGECGSVYRMDYKGDPDLPDHLGRGGKPGAHQHH